MKNLFYSLAKYIYFINIQYFIKLTGQNAIFPFYHLVSDKDVIHVKHLYKVSSTRKFIQDLDYLTKKYDIIDPWELISDFRHGNHKLKPGFLLSFDDGLSEFYTVIAPILRQKGIPAICFLNSKFIDNKDLFYRYKASIIYDVILSKPIAASLKSMISDTLKEYRVQFDEKYNFLFSIHYLNKGCLDKIAEILEIDLNEYLLRNKPYLSGKQIEELKNQGFLFGSHSIDHPLYSDLPFDQQLMQTKYSMEEIATKYQLNYRLFSFPFTDFGLSGDIFKKIFDENENPIDLSFGCAGLKKDKWPKNLQRIPFEAGDHSSKEIIYGEYLYYIFKGLIGKNTLKR